MRRREFVTLLGGAAVWPIAARGQQSERARRIGILMGFAENDEVWQAYLASFRRSLKDLGWVEDRNIRFDYRFAGDSPERTRAAAEELVALAPDLIFVSTNPALSATMEATRIIPIVFTWVSDSVGSGYVASLAHPGGNVTGFHNFEPAFGGKWLEVLKEVAPSVRRVAVLHVPEISANLALLRATETASKALGITIIPAAARNAGDVERVLTAFAREPNGGLIVTPSPLTGTRRDEIIGMARKLALPAVYSFGFTPRAAAWCRMESINWSWCEARRPMWIAFCAGQTRASFRCNCQPSTSWWSISRPQRPLASKFRRRCSPAPTR